MHEFSLTDNLIDLACEEAFKAGIARLDKIIVQVGALSGISIDSIEFAFGILRDKSEITNTSELVIEKIPGTGICTKCGKEIELDRLFLYCPYCETTTVNITGGKEFILRSLEGKTEGENHG
ncbi:MAG: hydrogenase maturation nickel metallochaperone HypA [bacterium]|nr:hydrogenase maturation nickel metallochaperone HypA [bacterium]